MRLSSLVGLAAGLAPTVTSATLLASRSVPNFDFESSDHYVLNLRSETDPHEVATILGLRYDGQLGALDNIHVFTGEKTDRDIVTDAVRRSKARKRSLGEINALNNVRFVQKQKLKPKHEKRIIPPRPEGHVATPRTNPLISRHYNSPGLGLSLARRNDDDEDADAKAKQTDIIQKLDIQDPIFKDQWHLLNTKQPGHDVNVTDVWLEGVTGSGSIVAVVDDGLDMYSKDLKDNYYAEGSYDFNDRSPEPKPRLSDDHHGTRCAGEIAAVRNDVCGLGVAFNSKIAGLRILSKMISDADEAVAMTYDYEHNQIYSCSWGPPDDGRSMEAPGVLIRQAMLKGIQDGRNGLGSIYVFASGNGAASDDNCNFDGYTNSIYSITVGAVDHNGDHPYYSEKCSANLAVTYSSGSGDAIHTTDVGVNNCYSGHGGTSAAAPLAAGILALVLQVRPDLGWRDMQWLVVLYSKEIHPEDEKLWQQTTIGRKYSHVYGYGALDTYSIVQAAKIWKKVKPQSWFFTPWQHVNKEIPQGSDGLVSEFEITEEMLKNANLERIEHVTITMNVKHERRGDLNADLISPSGVVSHISAPRRLDASSAGYDDWTFMSVVHWGEPGIGTWKIIIKDTIVNDKTGVWTDWHLKLWGECIDPEKATKLPMPTEEDDADHDKIETQIASVSTTSIPESTTPASEGLPTTVPTDHPDRPTKPSTSESGSFAPSPTFSGNATSSLPTSTSTTEASSWVDWLPSFGSSARVWIIGASVLIASFCAGLGVYFFLARRKRLANDSRNAYEFEPLQAATEDSHGLEKGASGRAGGNSAGRTRGGELYDAFAGGSDDEDEFDNVYRDRPQRAAGASFGVNSGTRSLDDEPLHTIGDDDDDDDNEDDDDQNNSSSAGDSDRENLLRGNNRA
ncbi:Protease KEX1 [Ceratocystis platani]|uniref:Protease KEX1 n=1 Tax=Ceratocystis fimbriata f. sp. platani TaxID=88771 RepID=A0A0F8DJ13_CERFI|nr:Protease KEX1 [Ceratocystis platani]